MSKIQRVGFSNSLYFNVSDDTNYRIEKYMNLEIGGPGMRKIIKQRLLNSCLVAVVVLSPTLTPLVASAASTSVLGTITRLGGTDQYETAAKIALQGWPQTTDNVVLSSGLSNTLVDALAAGPLATKLQAPILLTDNGQALNPFTKAELLRLKPKKAFITSGNVVIKQSVLDELTALGITPVPLGGFDQYETSVNIAKELIAQGADVTKVVIAAGWMAPVDALSISSIAAAQGIPILATTRDALPPSTKNFLSEHNGITDSYVIGGTAVVGETISGALPGTIHRYFGTTKFDTNLEVLKGFAAKLQYDTVYVANGETLVDALAGTSLAALTHSPIVLSQSEWAPKMKEFLEFNHLLKVVALGGVVVVPDEVLQKLPCAVPITPPVTPPVLPPTTPVTPTTPTIPPVTTSVTLSNLRVITNPANSLGTFNNGQEINLSGLADSVSVLGFSVTADKNCTLQFKVLSDLQNISLLAGQERIITMGDLILGGQIPGGINLGDFRLLYQTAKTKTLQGKVLSNGVSVGTLTVKLRFLN